MHAATPAPSLPEDPAALRAMLLAVLEQRDTLAAERDAAVAQNERLLTLLAKLRRVQFGRKSERLPEDQLLFAFEEIEATLAEGVAEAGKQSPKLREQQTQRRRANRGHLPAHLPRLEQVLRPARDTCPCCHGALVEIGADTAERLDVTPPSSACWSRSGRSWPAAPVPGWCCRHLRPSVWCPAGCRPRLPSPRCWSPATPTTCPCIGRRR